MCLSAPLASCDLWWPWHPPVLAGWSIPPGLQHQSEVHLPGRSPSAHLGVDQESADSEHQLPGEPGARSHVIAISQLLLIRWWPTRPSCSPLCQSCIYKTSGGELITIVSIWMKHQSDLKLLNWCQLFTELCPGRMMGQCSSVWPTARLATSLWSSKWSWMSSVSI